MNNNGLLLDIASVERETGIGKDALRVWEKRYGFPLPVRDERDERLYPEDQVERLRLIKSLLTKGMRPAKVVGLEISELNELLLSGAEEEPRHPDAVLGLANLIRSHQASDLRVALNRAMLTQGLSEFLSTTVAPLNQLIGEAWLRGEMRVFEEHLYSDQLTGVLRDAVASIRDTKGTPRILLTTLPGEEHSLGLLMAEATLSLRGANCVMLGVQTPINEIVAAITAHESDIVVLSFSAASTPVQVKSGLQQARKAIPDGVELWAGGAGVTRQRKADEGVRFMDPLSDLVDAVDGWRDAKGLSSA